MPYINIVDANSIGYAGQSATELSSGDQPTQAIFNTLANLRFLKSAKSTSSFIYLWDCKAQFRFDLLPDYKAGRDDTPEKRKAKEEYHSQQPYIKKLLSYLGVGQCEHIGFEADDIAYHLVNVLQPKGYEIKLVSSDKDWLQMVTKNVTWYDPRFERTCTETNFAEIAKAKTAMAFVDCKCIKGDKSDNVQGIKGLGDKACELIFDKWPNVVAMVKEHRKLGGFTKENIGPEFSRYLKPMNALCANTDGVLKRFKLNRLIMDLSKAPAITGLKITKGKKDPEAFFDLCGQLAFSSIIRKRDMWMRLFFSEFLEEVNA